MARLPLLHSDDAPSSASETLKKKNYLPEWLLESKRALEVSASNREVVEAKLSELKTGIDLLGDTIDEHRRRNKERSAREKAGLPPLSSYLTSTSAELCLEGGGGGGGCDLRNLQPLGLHYLPTVLTNIVAGFSCCADLLIFAGTCAAAHDYLKQEECWLELHRRHCLFIWTCNPSADLRALAVCPRRIFRGKSPLPPEALLSSNRNGGAGGGGGGGGGTGSGGAHGPQSLAHTASSRRALATVRGRVAHHGAALARCVNFLRRMRRERSTRRTKDPSPRVFSRRDKNVSHPLPVLLGKRGVGSLGDTIMSEANTLSAEGRQQAMRDLEVMALLSANREDQWSLGELRGQGGVTVLVALLANESGAIQELACAALANLLCTAGVRFPMSIGAASFKHRSPAFSPPRLASSVDVDPRLVLERCNGKQGLVALLTSPGARVNLVTTTIGLFSTASQRGGHGWGNNNAADRGTTGNRATGNSDGDMQPPLQRRATRDGPTHRAQQTTSFCMGMASKHASRALMNFFLPSEEIARSMFEDAMAMPWEEIGDFLDQQQLLSDELPFRAARAESSEEAIGAEQLGQRGQRRRRLPSQARQELEQQANLVHRTAFEEYEDYGRHGEAAGLWMAYYYYSSGTEKDVAPLELAMTADGMCYGRGTDSMGRFSLKGSCRELAQGSSNLAYNFAKTCKLLAL